MPLFEYKCKDCGMVMEILMIPGKSENIIQCEKCGSTNLEKLFSPPFINVRESSVIMSHCGNQSPCCGASTPCEKRPCDS